MEVVVDIISVLLSFVPGIVYHYVTNRQEY